MACTLTSKGLECFSGRKIIKKALEEAGFEKDKLKDKNILICTLPKYGIEEVLTNAVLELGFVREKIHICSKQMERRLYDFVYVSEGNIYELASFLFDECKAEDIIKESIKNGPGYYIGASAGAMLASTTIKFAAEKNEIGLTDYHGLDLLGKEYGGTVFIPHYNKREFERWKRFTPEIVEYAFATNIPENGFKNF